MKPCRCWHETGVRVPPDPFDGVILGRMRGQGMEQDLSSQNAHGLVRSLAMVDHVVVDDQVDGACVARQRGQLADLPDEQVACPFGAVQGHEALCKRVKRAGQIPPSSQPDKELLKSDAIPETTGGSLPVGWLGGASAR